MSTSRRPRIRGLVAVPALAAAVALAGGCAAGQDSIQYHEVTVSDGFSAHFGTLSVGNAYVAGPVYGSTAYGYVVLGNSGPGDDAVTGITSPDATSAEIHTVGADGTVGPVATNLVIPSRGALAATPGHYAVVFAGLHRALRVGDSISVTMTFQNAGEHQMFWAVSLQGRRSGDSAVGAISPTPAASDTPAAAASDTASASPSAGPGAASVSPSPSASG